jgi:hypothetical protein
VSTTMTGTGANRSALSLAKRYGVLAYGAFGTMADVGMMVAGSVLVGLALSLLLGGFGLISTDLELGTGAMIVSALVLGMTGGFFLGLAAEGPLGRGRRLVGFQNWEVGIGRTLAVFAVGLIGLFFYRFLTPVLQDLPEPLAKGNEAIRAVAVSGMVAMPLVGVPLTMALRIAPWDQAWLKRADMPVMFVVWAIAALVVL